MRKDLVNRVTVCRLDGNGSVGSEHQAEGGEKHNRKRDGLKHSLGVLRGGTTREKLCR